MSDVIQSLLQKDKERTGHYPQNYDIALSARTDNSGKTELEIALIHRTLNPRALTARLLMILAGPVVFLLLQLSSFLIAVTAGCLMIALGFALRTKDDSVFRTPGAKETLTIPGTGSNGSE